jgi:hypothetical protein
MTETTSLDGFGGIEVLQVSGLPKLYLFINDFCSQKYKISGTEYQHLSTGHRIVRSVGTIPDRQKRN